MNSELNRNEYSGLHGLFLILFMLLSTCVISCDSVEPADDSIDPDKLLRAKNQLIERAVEITRMPPISVTDNKNSRDTVDSRIYVSLADYWWPDPTIENGLPYIRKDGEVNPETRSNKSDLPGMIEMAERIQLLAQAYKLTEKEIFAESAIEQLAVWFVNSSTAMLPHLEHAQMVKGRNTGRSYGMIDTWWLVRVVEGIHVLQGSRHFTQELESKLKAWFTHYLNWLQFSDFGLQESRAHNNHGTWYDVQFVTFSKFTGQENRAKEHLSEITRKRIQKQISWNGSQKYEIRRPRPEHYSIYNLYGLMKLASHGRQFDEDLTSIITFFKPNLKIALRYLNDMMQEKRVSEFINSCDRTDTDRLYAELLLMAAELYSEQEYYQKAISVLESEIEEHPELISVLK